MRFQLATLCAALLATAATAIPIPAVSFPMSGTASIVTLDGANCVLHLENFGDFTGYSDNLGTYHPDTNSCSTIDPTDPLYFGSANHKTAMMWYPVPFGQAGAGTITVIRAHETFHGTINPNIVGTAQPVTVHRGWPAGYTEAALAALNGK